MILKSLFRLFYPNLCFACGINLVQSEKTICLSCLTKIPQTDYHTINENPVARLFYGRVDIENATAMCFYDKESSIQHLMHGLKYKNKPEIGIFFGQRLGKLLLESPLYKDIELVLPIPLHPKKERIRGYNQSMVIAQGLIESMPIKIVDDVLVRIEFTETQTRKNRWDRYQNVRNMFGVKHPEKIAGKHLLLVDDVITTGATIEACAQHLLKIEGVRVSIAGIASPAR
ncbi:MAG: ComF family protein [Bacteroidetes bacterium HGW-Bacteroidetes-6]|jgi:ComF family protein|nr:MAG: ComF family protein [Bacteroidetes bacterium HGW-Bacteroidetes-6]